MEKLFFSLSLRKYYIMKRTLILFSLCMVTLITGAQSHFLTDGTYRQRVESDFQRKMGVVGEKFFDIRNLHPDLKETEALKFLYAYMPLGDVTDYSTSYYLENVKTSFRIREEMPWGNRVPELLFRHFVLPIRVNNENLDNARMVFFPELKKRIQNLSMRDAILEVNHWCHEKVTYQPSDARTSSPLASVCNAYGRCGEESTLMVAALRSVGIPARQVYTPRWAHTDDNHAWVEAWADGKWYFFGACEPEPVLNLGWFNSPASRAMLMHTRVFGHYNGPEEVMLETPNFTEINLIDNYAATARVDFEVLDTNGRPVDHARVDFKIYNYAEFYTVATKYTDAKGKTFLTSGKGDMMVWVSKNGKYNYAKVSFGKDSKVTLRLTQSMENDKIMKFNTDTLDIIPPKEQVVLPHVDKDMQMINDRRKVTEDSIRHAYMNTFLDKEKATAIAESLSLSAEKVVPLLVASRGNHAVITDFLKKYAAGENGDRAVKLLEDISSKDLRDVSMNVLEDNFTAEKSELNPRVADEMLRPYKNFFLQAIPQNLQKSYRESPELLVQWCKKNIRIHDDMNSRHIPMSAEGVWKSGVADLVSRDIFFVNVARSLGIDARKDPVTLKIQYRNDKGTWMDVDFNSMKSVVTPTGKLALTYQPTSYLANPKYYSHFTISKINNGITSLLSFNEGEVDMGGGVNWENTFKKGVDLDEGTYILVTGTRLADGSVLASTRKFVINKGKTTTLDLVLRNRASAISVIGGFDSELKFFPTGDSTEKSILAQTGRGYFAIGLLGVGQEPTNHALNDLAKMKDGLEKWGRPILLLFGSEEEMSRFKREEFGALPSTVCFGIDKSGEIKKQIMRNMHLSNEALLPIFFIADTFNRVVFISQGYTIGLGEQLNNVAVKIGK